MNVNKETTANYTFLGVLFSLLIGTSSYLLYRYIKNKNSKGTEIKAQLSSTGGEEIDKEIIYDSDDDEDEYESKSLRFELSKLVTHYINSLSGKIILNKSKRYYNNYKIPLEMKQFLDKK